MPIHPHSGIATVTVFTEGAMRFEEKTAGVGTLTHGGMQSPLQAPVGFNYLLVTLKAGESWAYQPPLGHSVL
ncbi:pirin family protein [Pseudomonas viridiflava]|uniref:pirin family protein n=1 Tax=Pseudomonas viridiflava TaxID=33069 RepID=UPI000C0A4C27|nr:pirin family protein [Pseudomonas viridiflava]PHN62711.1 hypothetical protein AO275_03540 [Pseudomonas viridiflava]